MTKDEKILNTLKSTNFNNYRKDSIEDFIKDNIQNINFCLSAYDSKKISRYFKSTTINKPIYFTSTDIDTFLKRKFKKFIESDDNKIKIIDDFKKNELISDKTMVRKVIDYRLLNIANNHIFLVSSITDFYREYIMNQYLDNLITNKNYINNIIKVVNEVDTNNFKISKVEKNFIQNDLRKTLIDFLYLTFSNGFTKNIVISNSGVTSANEGDAIQFLFIARAMLAGFNCSNVDLRSSRYDAVIDINNKILRVQVKGISKNIRFKDRDRGGDGNDPSNLRNKGKVISSKDIDLFVAIQKNTGICYIIPAIKIDEIVDQLVKKNNKSLTYPISKLQEYKENWDIIYETSKNKKY